MTRFFHIFNTLLSIMNLEFFNWMKNYNGFTFNNPTEVESISGAAFFVKASFFNSIGGFDPKLFWMEDIDFCIRTSNKGYKTYYVPAWKVLLYSGKSSEKNYRSLQETRRRWENSSWRSR